MQNFIELNISDPVLRAISELGFETPSPIQAQALPMLLGEATDFLGLAATGTGKTAAFAIPLIERIDPERGGAQALVLCPTRELAVQVSGQIDLIGKYKGVRSVPIYGGAGYAEQIRGLRQGLPIVVGTPGRVLDHLNKGTLVLDQLETLVLDEADEMISMGFKEDIEAVLQSMPAGQAKTWLFSATMSTQIRKVADEYLTDPAEIRVNRKDMLPGTVEQVYFATQESNKPEVLCKLIEAADDFYGIIFCQTKSLVVDLTAYLTRRGYRVDCLHGDMDQRARERTMQAYRERKVTVLVATDVACRGLDVKDITHVINYSIPRELDNYVHRIGRTGRSGKQGLAYSLVTNGFRGLIGRIEQMTGSKLKEGKIPTRKELGVKKLAKQLATFQAQTGHERAVELLDDSWKSALEGMTKEEIAGRFLALTLPDIFAEREVTSKLQDSRGARPERGAERKSFAPRTERITPRSEAGSVIVKPLLTAATIERAEKFDSEKPVARKHFQKRAWDQPQERFQPKSEGDRPRPGKKPFGKASVGGDRFGARPAPAWGRKKSGNKPWERRERY